ncbi:MAG: type 2 isopentenyl-diphosphate Delta-isomerase [Candidatus Heimdallarchaeota archaeon]|nr:type 2 isopentenyl-diphosphate Delta-isomerase [Candidatus Heimdallarchaeota archaeon]
MNEKRKNDHIEICTDKKRNIEMEISTGFDDIIFVNTSVPDVNFDEINLETEFLGHKFAYPIFITGITGGVEEAKNINQKIAKAVDELGIGMGVGSQRSAIKNKSLIDTFNIVRQEAPNSFIAGNLGAVQLNYGFSSEDIQKAIDMINADAMVLHLNPLQEVVQPEGNTNFKNLLPKIEQICKDIDVPVILKEVGCGIPNFDIEQFIEFGVQAIDIAGAGGTSWSKIEAIRAEKEGKISNAKIGELFGNWGIPTAANTFEASVYNEEIGIISSGGIRNGLDAAKALSIGAHLVGISLPIIQIVNSGTEKQLIDYLKQFIQELKTAMFLVGAENLDDLKETPLVVMGRTAEWLSARGIEL